MEQHAIVRAAETGRCVDLDGDGQPEIIASAPESRRRVQIVPGLNAAIWKSQHSIGYRSRGDTTAIQSAVPRSFVLMLELPERRISSAVGIPEDAAPITRGYQQPLISKSRVQPGIGRRRLDSMLPGLRAGR